jgi:hypothetical protein
MSMPASAAGETWLELISDPYFNTLKLNVLDRLRRLGDRGAIDTLVTAWQRSIAASEVLSKQHADQKDAATIHIWLLGREIREALISIHQSADVTSEALIDDVFVQLEGQPVVRPEPPNGIRINAVDGI